MTLQTVWRGSPNYTPGRAGHNPNWTAADPNTWIVDHTTVSNFASANTRFTTFDPNNGASPTYMIDVDGTIYQYVKEADAPWTNGTMQGIGSNLDAITIEHVDNKNFDGPRDPRQIEASAQLHADISRRRGIPLVHRGAGGGVIGHRECSGASTRCPDALPVDQIIARANAILHPPAPAPQPPPDTRPEWQKNYRDLAAPQTFTTFLEVPIVSLVDGASRSGSVPVGTLVVAGETTAFGKDWWVTAYGKQHAHGLAKADVAAAIVPPPPPAPLPVPSPPPPIPPVAPPPVVPPGHSDVSFAAWIISLGHEEFVALADWIGQHLLHRVKQGEKP